MRKLAGSAPAREAPQERRENPFDSAKRMPLTQEISNIPQNLETSSNAAQIEYWNTTAGETWAQFQEALDRQVELLGLGAMDVLCPAEGEDIIDIGCGCGQTSLALAARVRPTGSVVGVDISEPMLDVPPPTTLG